MYSPIPFEKIRYSWTLSKICMIWTLKEEVLLPFYTVWQQWLRYKVFVYHVVVRSKNFVNAQVHMNTLKTSPVSAYWIFTSWLQSAAVAVTNFYIKEEIFVKDCIIVAQLF